MISARLNKRIRCCLLLFILFSFLPAGIISKHYLGARLDIEKNEAIFIDKFDCRANPHWTFNLSSELKITAITINGEDRKYSVIVEGPSQTHYKIHRNFWEAKDALINIEYFSDQANLFYEIIPNQLVQLTASEKFYPIGNEFTSQFEFHLQIPSGWKLISDGIVLNLKDKKNSYKISSPEKITQLNLFFLKNYQETPQLNKLLLTLYSTDLLKDEKEEIINRFFESLTLIQELLGPFPFPKFDLVFSQYEFESNSILFIDPENLSSELESLPPKIFNQYFYYYLFPENPSNLNWIKATEIYLLEYLPTLQRNPVAAQLFRKEILNSNSISITSSIFYNTSFPREDQYQIQNYLFLLLSLENQIGSDKIVNKIHSIMDNYAWNKINNIDFFSNLSENLFNEIEFYLTEWHSALPELPSIEIVESEKSVSLLQPEKVFPMLLPVTYYYSDNTTLDSTIYTKSFKTVLTDKLDSTVIKIEIDPQYHSLRSLNDTEIDSKLKDIFNYNYLQISISNTIANPQKIIQLISNIFINAKIVLKPFEDLDPNFPSIIIGNLPPEYKYLSTETDIILNGRKFYLKNHCIAYTFHNQKNYTNLILYSKSDDQILAVINKLKFFKNYGYFILRNGNNADKGAHETHQKHLVWEKK